MRGKSGAKGLGIFPKIKINFCKWVLIYEDDICGAISHERFLKLSAEYETEQKELETAKNWKLKQLCLTGSKSIFWSSGAIVQKYVGIRELTPTIVNEFVQKIIVHAPNKSSGHRRQKVQIIFNFIGEFDFAEFEKYDE